jgi:tetratricopeptide (TPR) repeat protein
MAKPETSLDERFRERYTAANTPEANARVERARQTVDAARLYDKQADGEEKERADLGRALGKFARQARLNGQLSDALDAWTDAIEVWRELGRGKATFLAELEHTATLAEHLLSVESDLDGEKLEEITGRFDALMARLSSSTDEGEDLSMYEDFIEEYRGRWHAQRAEIPEARAHMGRALELRRERGSARHIEQTERLLELLR